MRYVSSAYLQSAFPACVCLLRTEVCRKLYIYILALETASPGNQHCANCIGAISFPIGRRQTSES